MYGVGSISTSLGSIPPLFTSSSSEDQSLKKIIKEQSLLIQTQGNIIGKLNAVVCYLASKDSIVATILQSDKVHALSRTQKARLMVPEMMMNLMLLCFFVSF